MSSQLDSNTAQSDSTPFIPGHTLDCGCPNCKIQRAIQRAKEAATSLAEQGIPASDNTSQSELIDSKLVETSQPSADSTESVEVGVPKDAIRRLALIKPDKFQFDIALNDLALQYRSVGVRKDTIRKLVDAELHRLQAEHALAREASQQRRIAAMPLVDGAKLLSDIEALIDMFIWMEPSRRRILAVWIVHTWSCLEAASFTPYMHVRSPIKRCAKTLTELICKLLVWKPVFAANMTKASIVSNVSSGCTLLLDEVDTIFQGEASESTEEKRGILNAGYEHDGQAHKMVKDSETGDWVNEPYSVFGPKMIAGIGHLPDTVEDRSFDILLLRKPKHIRKERFIRSNSSKGRALRARFDELRQRIELWTAQNIDKLKEAEPDLSKISSKLDDRAIEIAEPLIAIADLAGGDWPSKIREAVVAVKSGQMSEDDSAMTRLLLEVRSIFQMYKGGKISTASLMLHLASRDNWRNFHGFGQPLQQRRLLSMLRDFEIHQKSIWIDGKTCWGFEAAQFDDAFESLPLDETVSSEGQVISLADMAEPSSGDEDSEIPDSGNSCGLDCGDACGPSDVKP